LGQAFGSVIYLRNLYFIHTKKDSKKISSDGKDKNIASSH